MYISYNAIPYAVRCAHNNVSIEGAAYHPQHYQPREANGGTRHTLQCRCDRCVVRSDLRTRPKNSPSSESSTEFAVVPFANPITARRAIRTDIDTRKKLTMLTTTMLRLLLTFAGGSGGGGGGIIAGADALPAEIRIGAIFGEDQRAGGNAVELAFRYAVERINGDETLLPQTRLVYDIEYVAGADSFRASKLVCRQVADGVQAIFGPTDATIGAHIQSICDALDIPHLQSRVDLEPEAVVESSHDGLMEEQQQMVEESKEEEEEEEDDENQLQQQQDYGSDGGDGTDNRAAAMMHEWSASDDVVEPMADGLYEFG